MNDRSHWPVLTPHPCFWLQVKRLVRVLSHWQPVSTGSCLASRYLFVFENNTWVLSVHPWVVAINLGQKSWLLHWARFGVPKYPDSPYQWSQTQPTPDLFLLRTYTFSTHLSLHSSTPTVFILLARPPDVRVFRSYVKIGRNLPSFWCKSVGGSEYTFYRWTLQRIVCDKRHEHVPSTRKPSPHLPYCKDTQ